MTVQLEPPFRKADTDDVAALARLINYAGEGIPEFLWARMAEPGQDPWEIGRQRQLAKLSEAQIFVIDEGQGAIAGLTGYAIPAEPDPIPDDMPAMFRSLQELENRAPSTWYVNVLAALPEHRGKGYGSRLLALAERIARYEGLDTMSLIVADNNEGGRRLYGRLGYTESDRKPMIKDGWQSEGTEWILLKKPLAGK